MIYNLYFVKRLYGYIELNHYSAESNYDNILKKGLLIPDKSNIDNVLDFGVGIYTIDSTTEEGEENIKDYLENYEDEYIAEFNINSDGEYFECIYGEGHVGYVLITQNIKTEMIDNADVLSVNDFLYSYDDF